MSECAGHALIRVYTGGHWFLRCVNPNCTYMIQESKMSKQITNLENAEKVSKSYLVDYLVVNQDLTRSQAVEAVNGVLDGIVSALAAGVNVNVSNIGTLRVEESPATTRRNPHTGERFPVPATNRVRFTTAPALLDAVNGRSDRTTLSRKAPKSY